MRTLKKPTLSWEDAPDVIGVEELRAILGIGKNYAGEIFNDKNFPKISGIGNALKADKEMARLFFQGFKVKDNPKQTMDYMILLELKKLNEKIQKIGEKEDEVKDV